MDLKHAYLHLGLSPSLSRFCALWVGAITIALCRRLLGLQTCHMFRTGSSRYSKLWRAATDV